ncbi:MAG TPA: F0F1 ATP synthase subunit delta [Fervidobacterium sp.]|nr:F0F1 ATP synthase subunit delta [Fervidobacterium sp.]
MMYSAVASRYAVALYKVSKVNGKTEEYKEQLKVLNQLYDAVSVFLNNQSVAVDERANFLIDLMKKLNIEIDEAFARFIHLLIANRRIKFIKQIASFFDYTILDNAGLIPVDVTSASELSSEELGLLSNFVKKYTGREPVFNVKFDEDLIAGVVLEFSGKKLDASIKGRLQSIVKDVLIRKG